MAEASRAETQRQLVELLDYPREDLDTEIKDWLQLEHKRAQADLARELIALANHGGGFLLFGFLDQDEGWSPSGPCPFPLKHYSQDAINNVLKTYAEPPFECFVDRLESAAGNTHVVIRVPGDHRVPIRSKRAGPDGSRLKIDTYYLRRPGAESAPPQSAREWDDLLRRCISAHREELLESFRNIVGIVGAGSEIAQALGAGQSANAQLETWEQESAQRLMQLLTANSDESASESRPSYRHGWWASAYTLEPVEEPPTRAAFLDILNEVQGNETGWPVWLWLSNRPEMRPRPVGDVIECWLNKTGDDAHADFWRAHPCGRMFLLRGYQEDTSSKISPGKHLDLTLPVWRTGECLLHASRLARRLGTQTVDFSMTWTGLQGRELGVALSQMRHVMPGRTCAEPEVRTSVQVEAASIADALPEIVKQLVAPLYERFDFFVPPNELYTEEVTRMRRGI